MNKKTWLILGTLGIAGLFLLAKKKVLYVNEGESIQEAIDSITDASAEKKYIVKVGPGLYNERVKMRDHIDLKGSGINKTKITHEGVDFFDLQTICHANNVKISDMTIEATGFGIGIGDFNCWKGDGNTFDVENCHIDATSSLMFISRENNIANIKNCTCECHTDGFIVGSNSKIQIDDVHVNFDISQNTSGISILRSDSYSEIYANNVKIKGILTNQDLFHYKIVFGMGIMKLHNIDIDVQLTSTNENSAIFGVAAVYPDANIELFGGKVHVSAPDGVTNYDLMQDYDGILTVHGTEYNTSKGIINQE